MSLLTRFQDRYEMTQQEEYSLQEYLELCKQDNTVYASAAERLLIAIGEPEVVDTALDPRLSRIFSNKVIKRYPAFNEFYGMEECIENIVSYFKHAAQGLEERKQILYLLGPVGGGKSSLAEKLKSMVSIAKEFYLGIVIDRSRQMPVLMASREGGVEIEEVARRSPDLILKEHIHPAIGLRSFLARKIAFGLGLEGKAVSQAVALMRSLYQSFESTDASLIEINPLVVTEEGQLLALDAKMNFDDNALYRHPEIEELRDLSEEEPLEIEASRHRLNYIKLDGDVGCMVNGAGLAMATMDIIKLAGGSPANFLDVGGGASVDQIKNALRILLSDPNVKSVLINIFGGILRCDVLAEGVVQAAKDIGVSLPIVVRLEGTNVEEGRAILKNSDLDFEVAADMADAARRVCAAG